MSVSPQTWPATPLEREFAGDVPLIAVMRGPFVGSLHRGIAAVVGPGGDLRFALGDTEQPVFLRSAAKPFQVMPALLSGALERFGIGESELAVMAASHSGEERHQDAVRSVLAKLGLDESALHCGIHPPLHEPTAVERNRRGLAPTPACNNCSGAHAGMLAACRANGWSIDDYGLPQHPLQVETRAIIERFAGLEPGTVEYAGDNCHVPTFRLPVRAAALAFSRLAGASAPSDELGAAAARVSAAMTACPEMVGGEDRFDTDLMRAAGGSIVAKGGAEGFQAVGTRSGFGLAMKVTDGNSRALPPAVLHILAGLDIWDCGDALSGYREPVHRDREGEVVGRAIPVFSAGPRA